MTATFEEGVLAQPENLRAAAAATREALGDVDLAQLRRGTLVLSGIGASWHALEPTVRALRAAGRRAVAIPAAELAEAPAARLGDAFVLVSQSGASTETVAALERLEGATVVAVTADPESPLGRGATARLPLGPVPDTSVSTLSYTATLQTLGMLCDAVLGRDGAGWDGLADLAGATLEASAARAEAVAERMVAVRAVDAVGGGAGVASAGETALLAREALRLPAAGAETREYLHGPMEPVGPDFGCFVFGAGRERRLARTLASYGARVALIGAGDAPVAGVESFPLPVVAEHAAPVLAILPVQLVVLRLAARRGLAIDGLRRAQDDTKLSARDAA
jgi:glucosamine--fructose-6-phosphate aminotransferase (isomerizing)